MSEDTFSAQSKKQPLKKQPLKKQPHKTSGKKENETKKPDSHKSLNPIYWVRLLGVLSNRKKDEEDYKSNPTRYASSEKNYSDLKFEGLKKDDLTKALAGKVSNSKIRGIDYNDVLELLMDPVAPYVNAYYDKKEKYRYRITLLGELALKQIEKEKDEILSGFWNIVKETNPPKKFRVT